MADKDEQKTQVEPKPTEGARKTTKNGAHTIPIQMM